MTIRLPREGRRKLANQCGLPSDQIPTFCIVRTKEPAGDQKRLLFIGHLFPTIDIDNSHVINDHPELNSIEAALSMWAIRRELAFAEDKCNEFTRISGRACLNLMLMLVHYGYQQGPPLDPAQYERHRRIKHLQHFKHADFLTVEMEQHVTVRALEFKRKGDPLHPTGIELAPHWRKGHWRAWPGYGEKRAQGEQVPLVFVKPCLVRPDRTIGDIGDSEAEYTG